MKDHIYTRLLQHKSQGHAYANEIIPREVKGNRTRLLGKQGGPWCQHVSDMPTGTLVRVPVDEALAWLRKKAWDMRDEKQEALFSSAMVAQDPNTGEALTGAEAKGHLIWILLLGAKVKVQKEAS